MSFEIPDWDGDSFSYHFDEATDSQLLTSCIRNSTGDHLKIKKRRKKKNSKAEKNTNTDRKLQVFCETEGSTSSAKKKLKNEGRNCTTPNDTVGEETKISEDVNIQTVSSSEKNVTPPKGTGKQEVIESTGMVSKKAKKKKNRMRNKYKELADRQRQARKGREVCGIKNGNAVYHSSDFNLPTTASHTSLDSHCRKSENVESSEKVPLTDIVIDNISTGKECNHHSKAAQLIVKQDSCTDMPLAADQWKPVHEIVECNGDESSQVQSSGKIKRTKKKIVKQESNLDETISKDAIGGSDADCGAKANKKIGSKQRKVKKSESDDEIICEISDDESGQDQTLQTDLEAFITTLNFGQFSTKKKSKKLCKDDNVSGDNFVTGTSKSILEEKVELNSQKDDQGEDVDCPKVKRKKKQKEKNKDEVTVSVSDNTNLVNDSFVKNKEACKEVAIEDSASEKKKKIKGKKEHTNKCKNIVSSSENTISVLDNYINIKDKEEKGTIEDIVAGTGGEDLPIESSPGGKITELKEKKKKKRKRNSIQTEEVHQGKASLALEVYSQKTDSEVNHLHQVSLSPGTAATELSSDISPNKKHKFDREKLAEMLKAADLMSRPTATQVSRGSLRDKMEQQLNAARFRFINEKLYSTTGSEAQDIFKSDPEAFQVYHSGYQRQVSKWPINPLDLIINVLKDRPSNLVVADFGCGEARLAKSLPQMKVHSLDLVALNPLVTACNMANTNLASESIDIVVFCLSLMGTNVCDFILEANRVLKIGGLLKVAEVESRFSSPESFAQCLAKYGFQLTEKDTSHKFFWLFDFKKKRKVKTNFDLPKIYLKPCVYKKR